MSNRFLAGFVCLFVVVVASPLSAQRAGGGKFVRDPFTRKMSPFGSFSVIFPSIPVNTKIVDFCYFNCFYQTGSPVERCDLSGTFSLTKSLNPPFRALNLRRAPTGNCGGTPTSLPITLNAGEWLLHDFEFAPTTPGNFSDSLTYSASIGEPFSWLLSGSTFAGARVQLAPQTCSGSYRSVSGSTLTSIEFVNTLTEPVVVFWIDYNGLQQQYYSLPPATSFVQITYVTHPWILIGQNSNRCYGVFTALAQPGRVQISGCVPPAVAPQVSTPNRNVTAGDEAAVNWSTTESVDRFIVEVSGNASFSPLQASVIVPGSQRSTSLRFPSAGTSYVRVFAENSCGRREGSPVLSFTVSPPPPRIVATTKPSGLLQVLGQPASDSYTLANLGGTSTLIRLLQSGGSFFTQSPTEFTLAPGANQTITLTAAAQAAGNYQGESIPTGNGVPAGLSIPVRLIATTQPQGDPDARAETNRVDLAAPEGAAVTGSIRFTNRGTGPVKGILISNVPWIVPLQEFVNIAAGQTAEFTFRIDRAMRPNAFGSALGTLMLVYLQGTTSTKTVIHPLASTPPPGSKTTVVSVSDTVKPAVSTSAIPPLAAGELALFVPGVGHAQGSVGLFVSDISILNSGGVADLRDLRLYYIPSGGAGASSQLTTVSQLSANQTVNLTDVVKSVFNQEAQVGSLQLRTNALAPIAINANIFNASNVAGTYGTTIPVFRSDRSLGPQESLYLTGLRKDDSGHTNLYIQETAGQDASVLIDFRSASGAVLGTRPEGARPFALQQVINPLPEGTVAAIVTNTSANGAQIQAYATPVDRLSGDTWSVADWSRQYGYSTTESMMVPVAGVTRGANNSFFRTDIALMNTGTTSASGTLRYYPSGAAPVDRVLTLGPRESRIVSDVIGSFFGFSPPSVGYLVFTPTSGPFVLTSRTYTTVAGQSATFGTGVPTVAVSASLKPGQARKLGGLEDSTLSTVQGGKPATYRTNFGIVESKGEPVTVRATLRYTAVQGSAAAVGLNTADFNLGPQQFLLVSRIANAILGANRGLFGDLRDIQVDFEVISGTGNAVVFTTSTDNGTNDTALRVE